MSEDKERFYEDLFNKLDANKDGTICLSDLANAFPNLHVQSPANTSMAKMFIEDADSNKDGVIDFEEFVKYIEAKDKRICFAFKQIDFDGDNSIDIDDLMRAFRNFNISLSTVEAKELMKRIDTKGNLKISIDEWREFLFLHPAQSLSQIIYFWQHGNFIDAGGDWVIPDEFEGGSQMMLQTKRLLSGALAGALSRTCTAPLDRVKVLLQVHGYKHVNSGIWQALVYMVKEGGILSLWRGNGINVVKIAPETALKYSLYEYYKMRLHLASTTVESAATTSGLSLHYKFLAGSLAGVSAQTVMYPFETLKTRLCLRKTGQFNSSWHCVQSIYREGGLRSFYRGFLVNAMGIIPYAGIELTLYEKSKSVYLKWRWSGVKLTPGTCSNHDRSTPHWMVIPMLSSFSATCGILTTYPLALIRTKLQSKTAFSEPQVNSAGGLLMTIWRSAGIAGLYRGLNANLCKVLPASSISYVTYEYLNSRFDLQSFGNK